MSVYTIPFVTASISAAQDFLEITAGATRGVRLLRAEACSSSGTGQQIEVQMLRRSAAGTGGTTATPSPHIETDAPSFTVQKAVTTPGGANGILWRSFQASSSGWLFRPFVLGRSQASAPSDESLYVAPTKIISFALITAPTTLIFTGYVTVEELGA